MTKVDYENGASMSKSDDTWQNVWGSPMACVARWRSLRFAFSHNNWAPVVLPNVICVFFLGVSFLPKYSSLVHVLPMVSSPLVHVLPMLSTPGSFLRAQIFFFSSFTLGSLQLFFQDQYWEPAQQLFLQLHFWKPATIPPGSILRACNCSSAGNSSVNC